MTLIIKINLDESNPKNDFNVYLKYLPDNLKLSVEQRTKLLGLMSIIIEKLPGIKLFEQ